MSLFKTREFWCTETEDDEYFDQNSMIVTKLNGDCDFIVTGSQSGVLRIFKPSCELKEDNTLEGFKASDVFIEKIINNPILQVGAGKLISGSQNVQIAILHSRLFSVYTISIKEGSTDCGTQNMLELLYEHNLRRSAANFVIGSFGGIKNREFICVQSLDGMLTFYEQEMYTFSCFLPDFLLPSPFAYVAKTDSFITASSSWCIESYRYKILSEKNQNTDEKTETREKMISDWSYNLGEAILELKVLEKNETWIMLLGERNLYCLSDKGRLKFMKRLDYSPVCFYPYILEDKILSMVVSETSTLIIYQNTSVKWSAQLQFIPICITRAFFQNIHGAVVMLSDEGRLECCYLGTTPNLFVAPPLNAKQLDFDKVEEELTELNIIIKKSQGSDINVANKSAEKELIINPTVNTLLENCNFTTKSNIENNKMCAIKVDITPQTTFEEIQIAFHVDRPMKVTPQAEFFSDISEKTSVTCFCYLDEDLEVGSLKLKIAASYITNLGVPKIILKEVMLPANMILEMCTAQKENVHKLTLNINKSPVPLSVLFPEFAGENSFNQSTNATGFKTIYGAGQPVSILLAKSSERYRVQSDSFISLSLLIELITFRLRRHFANKPDFSITYSSSLPANEISSYIGTHFEIRQNVNNLQNELSQLSSQFRVIQKRFIAKFKVKNPTSLSNLELLLQDTYNEIMRVNDELEISLGQLSKSQLELSYAVNVVKKLVEVMEIKKDLKDMIVSTFCENICDLETQNWEDVMDVALSYLLRTELAKSDKDKLRAAHTSFEEIKDISKLQKHLGLVLERIPKTGIPENQDSIEEENIEKDKDVLDAKESLPIGSEFGQSSSRILSARKSLLKKRLKLEEKRIEMSDNDDLV